MNDLQHRLIVNKGPEPGKVYELTSVSMTIGRDPMVEIVINDPEVSRRHARLIGTLTGYRIQDLGSTNGTFVDGVRLSGEPVDLKIGQVISIGGGVAMAYRGMDDDDVQSATLLETAMVPPEVQESSDRPAPVDIDSAADLPDPSSTSDSEQVEPAGLENAVPDIATEEEDQPSGVEPSYQATILESPQQEEETPPLVHGETESYEAEDFSEPVVIPQQGEADQPPAKDEGSNFRRLSTIIAAIVLLVLCCCCSLVLFLYYYGGDWLLRQLGLLP